MNGVQPAATTSNTGTLANLLLLNRRPNKAESLAIAMVIGQVAVKWIQGIRARSNEKNTVTLRFRENTQEFHWLCRWIASQPRIESETRERSFTARTVDNGGDYPCAMPCGSNSAGERKPAKWALLPDTIQGFRFEEMVIGISREDSSKDESGKFTGRSIILTCLTRNMESVDRLLRAIYEAGVAEESVERKPAVHVLSRWDDWSEVRKAPTNRMPVLPEGILESLTLDMEWFLENEEWYRSVGVPYRRGYLFHGIPGSGKTTLAIALAAKFRKDIYILPLASMTESSMVSGINHAPRNGILLLEDIDCADMTLERGSQERQVFAQEGAPTLQGLLNAIDGAATPEGRIIIATTNRRNVLDPALVRPGRFDKEHEFKHADYHQIVEMCRRFGLGHDAESVAEEWHAEALSMATVQKRLIERCGIGK